MGASRCAVHYAPGYAAPARDGQNPRSGSNQVAGETRAAGDLAGAGNFAGGFAGYRGAQPSRARLEVAGEFTGNDEAATGFDPGR